MDQEVQKGHGALCSDMLDKFWLSIGWQMTGCTILILVSADAFSRNAAVVNTSARTRATRRPDGHDGVDDG